MHLIVGLGNPGTEYERTRHNVGFLVVEEVARRLGVEFRAKNAWKATVAQAVREDGKILLAKPKTFMNLSGEAVRTIMQANGLDASRLLVVYDEADLPFGEIRFRASGSAGGHNGMKSILGVLPNSTEVARVRVGVGRPEHPNVPLENWVLGSWTPEERAALPEILSRAADEIEKWLAN